MMDLLTSEAVYIDRCHQSDTSFYRLKTYHDDYVNHVTDQIFGSRSESNFAGKMYARDIWNCAGIMVACARAEVNDNGGDEMWVGEMRYRQRDGNNNVSYVVAYKNGEEEGLTEVQMLTGIHNYYDNMRYPRTGTHIVEYCPRTGINHVRRVVTYERLKGILAARLCNSKSKTQKVVRDYLLHSMHYPNGILVLKEAIGDGTSGVGVVVQKRLLEYTPTGRIDNMYRVNYEGQVENEYITDDMLITQAMNYEVARREIENDSETSDDEFN